MPQSSRTRPLIGITADLAAGKFVVDQAYTQMVVRAGGTPILLPCLSECVDAYLDACQGIILTGGDDPIMSRWGVAMHSNAKPVEPERQAFELALLDGLETRQRDKPVLGICLGMQLLGLHAGGKLDQYLPDTLPTAALHWDKRSHEVSGELGRGLVHSRHRQALTDAGRLRVIAAAPDGVIEAVQDDHRPFYMGVQWHPERTADQTLGLGVFRRLVDAASERS